MKTRHPITIASSLLTILVLFTNADSYAVPRTKPVAFFETNEGFFELSAVPPEKAKRIGINAVETFQKAALVTGAFVYQKLETLNNAQEIESSKQKLCTKDGVRIWFRETCDQLNRCKDFCQIKSEGHCGGVAIASNRFLTTRHCPLGEDLDSLGVKFLDDAGNVRKYPIKLMTKIGGYVAYDLALFEIEGRGEREPSAKVNNQIPNRGDWVFTIGFPHIEHRKKRSRNYSEPVGEMRLNIGQIVDPNYRGKSFCDFGFADIEVMMPERWKLETKCPFYGPHTARNINGGKYEAHAEVDPFLTNTDMLNGMSGAPLFNADGSVIGIGSAIIKNQPPLDYDLKYNAVYVKARHFRDLK